jgi:hypothetical protein
MRGGCALRLSSLDRVRSSHCSCEPRRAGDVLEEYEFHEEAKCADASGAPCSKQSAGLLQRRHVRIEWPARFIGKESNKLEEVEEGTVQDAGDAYTEYPDPRRDEWVMKILPFLRRAPAQVITNATGITRRTVQRIRNEQTKPTTEHKRCSKRLPKVGTTISRVAWRGRAEARRLFRSRRSETRRHSRSRPARIQARAKVPHPRRLGRLARTGRR